MYCSPQAATPTANQILKIATLAMLTLLLCSCFTDPYLLQDQGVNKYYLSDIIGDAENRGYISVRPTIVIDSILYRPDIELKKAPLPINKKEIKSLIIVSKQNQKTLLEFGIQNRNGAIIITTFKQP